MIGRLRHRIEVQEKRETPGPLGPNIEWVKVAERWGAFVEINLDGRAQYQQIGHSSVAGRLVFRGPLDLNMANHRFLYKGEYYETVEPPSNPDTVNRLVSVVVKKIPQQP